ncbi:PA domain protein [Ancylostoma ceylanicum]|uniref:PA domain protein n=1 Tax=Ancylostoma ceylanicum TaxID=53326 RepID=A0A0D6LBD5_9BILA|nr:PA domain protein [Ancylostoma ceylanicum]
MAKCGIDFMEELLHLIPQLEKEAGSPIFYAAPAQYGSDLKDMPVVGEAVLAEPLRACAPLMNKDQIRGRIAVVERSDCMFQQKTRHAQQAGAIAVVVIDIVIFTIQKVLNFVAETEKSRAHLGSERDGSLLASIFTGDE